MTAPGGDSGHSGWPAGGEQWGAPWNPPESPSGPLGPSPGDHPPALDYPTGYPPDYPGPAGYPQAFPPAGYPPPGYPQHPQYPQPDYSGGWGASQPAQPGMNGMAVASLICGLTGLLCCIGSIVAIVLGTVAIDQIKRNREEGYALAVSGIVLGVAGLLVYLIVAMFAMQSH